LFSPILHILCSPFLRILCSRISRPSLYGVLYTDTKNDPFLITLYYRTALSGRSAKTMNLHGEQTRHP
jgi:hypothetical protein